MFAPLTTQGTDSFDEGDDVAAFADTNGSPLNATDAARRLLADTSDLADQESPTPPQSGGGGGRQQQPAAANRIAAHLAKLRAGTNTAANKTTTTNGGYSAPTVNGGGAAAGPSQVDFTKDTSGGDGGASASADLLSMSASSTSFAPVTLPPPSSLSASEMESGSGGGGAGGAAFDREGSYTYASPASPPPMDSSTPFLVGHHDDEHGDGEYRMSSYFAQFVRDVTACTRKVCGDAGVVFLKLPRWAQGCVAVVVVIILVKILHAIF